MNNPRLSFDIGGLNFPLFICPGLSHGRTDLDGTRSHHPHTTVWSDDLKSHLQIRMAEQDQISFVA